VTGTFGGLNTARTALWAQQRAMDVTGQNIANMNTVGYSRQRADLQSLGGTAVAATYAVDNNVGGGVSAEKVTRIRDAFLESRAQLETASTASMTVADSTYSQIEDAFREPGDTGIQAQLSDMWAAWGDVHANSTNPGPRSEVLERTQTLVSGIRTTRATLDKQWGSNFDGLQTMVQDVNSTASSIADLNDSIRRASIAGLPTNELADKRDTLVVQLSQQIGATSAPAEDGSMTVSVGGTTLVTGAKSLTLKMVGSSSPDDLGTNPPRVMTDPGGTLVRPGGTAEGQLTAMTVTIPQYRNAIDSMAKNLAAELNTVHGTGYDQDGNKGVALLDDGAGDPTKITAANLTLAISDGRKIAASTLSPAAAGGSASGDSTNADSIFQLSLGTTGTDASYRKMIVSLGVQAQTATNRLSAQNVISTQVDSSRESVSGVNIDEEMSNLLQYQHAYAAAGKLVSTINDMLDTLINMVR
jgi:flagellar hook-associated protein 1 FlgK